MWDYRRCESLLQRPPIPLYRSNHHIYAPHTRLPLHPFLSVSAFLSVLLTVLTEDSLSFRLNSQNEHGNG